MTEEEFIKNIINANAKHVLDLKTEDEVKDWLNSLLWSVVGFMKNNTKKRNI